MSLKQTILVSLMMISVLPSGFAAYARDNSLLARVTVYWARGGRGSDRYTRQHKSATGQRLQQGHCAVDPRRIPYGSRVVMPDGTTLNAVDTGSAVRNRKAARKSGHTINERNAIVIDKFFETKRQALTWANTNPSFVSVKVIPPKTPSVSKPNITNAQPIALTQPNPTRGGDSTDAMTIANNAPTTGPTGGIVRNPLGRLGR
jgi:3D (Asp-Asp-Asp) domain-containing protein